MPPLVPAERGGVKIIVVTAVFTALATIAVILRFVAARLQRRALQVHDYLIMASWVFMAGYSSCAITGVMVGGSGSHLSRIITNPHFGKVTVVAGLKNFFATTFVWACATCLCKLSVLSLYEQLFPQRQFRYKIYLMMSVVAALWLGYVLTGLFFCWPIGLNWDKSLDGHCGSTLAEEIAFPVVNLVVDGLVIALPAPIVWSLKLPARKKFGISCMFGLGFIVCIMNAARIGTTIVADEADYTYTLSNVAIFSGLEIWLGIVAACVPLMKPLLTSFASGDSNRGSFKDRSGYWKFSRHTRSAETKRDGDADNWELTRNRLRSTFDKSRKPVIERPDDDILLLQNSDVPLHLGKSSPSINAVAPWPTPQRTQNSAASREKV